jgi:lysozyme-like protein
VTYSYAQLEAIAKEGGFSDSMAPLMAAIAMAESSGNPNAINPNDNGGTQTSWGLWQISNGTHNQPVPNILDPVTNAQQAFGKYQTQGLSAWGTYTSGAYRSYLQGQVPPDANIGPPAGGGSGGASGAGGTTASLLDPSTWFNSFLGPLADVTNYAVWVAITASGVVLIGAGIILLFRTSAAQQTANVAGRYGQAVKHVATLPLRYAK